MSILLDQLLARAGASDQNRDLWLSERQNGVTATEIKSLMQGEDPEILAVSKIMSTSPMEDNKYMAWGREREDIIGQAVTALYPQMFIEHRVFRSATNPRHLASPDMIGDMGDHLIGAEEKTSKYDLAEGLGHYERFGHFFQMQWQAYVCGFEMVVYAYESHNGVWVVRREEDFPVPEKVFDVKVREIPRDDSVIAEMIDTADKFLAIYDEVREDLS